MRTRPGLPCAAALLCGLLALAGLLPADEQQQPASEPPADAPARLDPVLFELSAATGGDVYMWARGELGRSGIVPPLSDEDLLLAYGRLDGGERTLALDVDPGLERLHVFIALQDPVRLELADPEGVEPHPGQTGVALTRSRYMLLAAIDTPAAGRWRLSLAGSGLYSLSVRASLGRAAEAPSLVGVELVEPGGRPGHEGLFARREPPAAGASSLVRVEIEHALTVELGWQAADGESLAAGACEPLADTQDERLWRCAIPEQPFRPLLRGRGPDGSAFQRVAAALITPR